MIGHDFVGRFGFCLVFCIFEFGGARLVLVCCSGYHVLVWCLALMLGRSWCSMCCSSRDEVLKFDSLGSDFVFTVSLGSDINSLVPQRDVLLQSQASL